MILLNSYSPTVSLMDGPYVQLASIFGQIRSVVRRMKESLGELTIAASLRVF